MTGPVTPDVLNALTRTQKDIYRANIAEGVEPVTALQNALDGRPVPGRMGGIGSPPPRRSGECPICGTVPACPPPTKS